MSNEITRAFVVDEWELRADGRTVDGRIVPYHEVAHVIDRDESGNLVEFDEQFLPGSCAAMVQACEARGNAAFVEFRLDHDEDFDGLIGHATHMRETEDGAHATFRLYESKDIAKVRSMLDSSHKGLSVKFKAIRTPKLIKGVVSHVQVAIAHVAATPVPVYAGAGITGMRAVDDGDGILPTPELDALKAWLETVRTPPVGINA